MRLVFVSFPGVVKAVVDSAITGTMTKEVTVVDVRDVPPEHILRACLKACIPNNNATAETDVLHSLDKFFHSQVALTKHKAPDGSKKPNRRDIVLLLGGVHLMDQDLLEWYEVWTSQTAIQCVCLCMIDLIFCLTSFLRHFLFQIFISPLRVSFQGGGWLRDPACKSFNI
jgi:hypothetical protein